MIKIFLIKAQFAANSELFARFATLSREILTIFTRHLGYAEVSYYQTSLIRMSVGQEISGLIEH